MMGHETNRTPNETATALERRLLEAATSFQRDLGREPLHAEGPELAAQIRDQRNSLYPLIRFGHFIWHEHDRYGKSLAAVANQANCSMVRCARALRIAMAMHRGLLDPEMNARTAEIACGMRDPLTGRYVGVWMALEAEERGTF